MDWLGVVGMLTGVGGVLIGGWGLRQAKLSREIAEEANQAARESAAAAQRANEIAEEANALSARAVTAVTDQHFVEWKPSWDERSCELRVYNRGGDDAHDVRLIVLAGDAHTTQSVDGPIPPGSWTGVHLPEVDQRRAEHEKLMRRRQADLASRGVAYAGGSFSMSLRVTVTWRSKAGLPKAESFDFKVA